MRDVRGALEAIYRRLLAAYGPQHWWPARTRFEVMVGAILTQSAAWTNVEKGIANLRRAGKLNPKALRETPEPELAALVFPCGYYNVKARKLRAFARWLGETCGDDLDILFRRDAAALRPELLAVFGIGEETADSMLLYAGRKPVFVIDAYTRRVLARAGIRPGGSKYADYQRLFTDNLPPDVRRFNEYHALFVRLGKERCRKAPLCSGCLLNPGGKTAAGAYPCAAL